MPEAPQCIRLRGVRQNNLQGFDIDLPLGRYIVVTGLSGTGKSSLVFDTLHAEGQRRYVETFSAYTRQFLDLLPKPQLDSAENIRPSIAIEQTNTVKTSRSTVGTMTELTDYAKVWFSHVAECFDPATGEKVEDDTPHSIWEKTFARHLGASLVVAFQLARPANLDWREILGRVQAQAYLRVLLPAGEGRYTARRVDEMLASSAGERPPEGLPVFVVQDRLDITLENRDRFLEATETALHFGQGELRLFGQAPSLQGDQAVSPLLVESGHYSRGLHSPKTGRRFRPASPGLFSFNSPIGACPVCRGFGRTIEVDYRMAVPDWGKSIEEGAIKCWEGDVYRGSLEDLRTFARKRRIPLDIPFASLTEEQRTFIIDGEPGYGEENGKSWPKYWYGIKGFFRWLEKNTYKMHVRVFLSRYRAYRTCPECGGGRLQPEALCWRWRGHTLPELFSLPVATLLELLEQEAMPALRGAPGVVSMGDQGGELPRSAAGIPAVAALHAMISRLRYLVQVGVGYLTLDRSSRTLSGGEVERVNLTTCLGTSLVDTLFVLDEPSVGLHPRDIDRLVGIIRTLTSAGNTVVVVEHDESMIRAADHVVELGPKPGAEGGRIVFSGALAGLLRHESSITGAYLSGRMGIPLPEKRRPVCLETTPPSVGATTPALRIVGATKHNLKKLSVTIPLRRFVALSGVSGSGKSTLLEHVLHQGLLTQRRILTEDPAEVERFETDIALGEIVLVDQSPLARTPRSNPALYSGAWERIRTLFAASPEAHASGFTASSFSFNGGDGRCDHCKGLGSERIEMQFLADVFVPCPLCEGRRFKPEVLAIRWNGKSVADLLVLSIDDALVHFASEGRIVECLRPLALVGLGYLTLGQPLNTLSGGEAQRLKLIRFLGGIVNEATSDEGDPGTGKTPSVASAADRGTGTAAAAHAAGDSTALLLLDEPTTGLHRHDVRRLLESLHRLVDRGHSLVVIEHNLDVLKSADWIVEIGPEAGADGGRVVAEGTPETLAGTDTATAPYLRQALGIQTVSRRPLPAAASDGSPGGALLPGAAPTHLVLEGARENNLRNLSVRLPHRSLNVVTGVSGSGKSTLAFDIIFAEGQRRFMESMSAYARQFVEQLPRPALDSLTGIPPTVAIEQRITRGSRKSTVATITEVAQYLRLLYAKLGVQHHPDSDKPVQPLSQEQLRRLLQRTLQAAPASRARHLYLCAPLVRGRKGHHQPIADWIVDQGFRLMRADGRLLAADAFVKLDRYKEHDIEVVVSDLRDRAAPPLAESLSRALALGKGTCFLLHPNGKVLSWLSTTRTDGATGESFPELDPKHFSHNSPRGWCPTCRGHGRIYPWMLTPEDEGEEDETTRRLREFGLETEEDLAEAGNLCPDCGGARLNRIARAVKLHRTGRLAPLSLPDLLHCTPGSLRERLSELLLDDRGLRISADLRTQIEVRLRFLEEVGLGYLGLDRATDTLSGGEAQRIRLAAQLGSNLAGVLYVLDEPSIGLHAADNRRLIGTLKNLREKGNTLLVVEHDDEVMANADYILDLGPGAGRHGGRILAAGTPDDIRACPTSLTGIFLARGIPHPLRGSYRPVPNARTRNADWLRLGGARLRNLDGFDLRLPCGRLILIAGPSGAGKSTLVTDLLQPAAKCAIEQGVLRLSGRRFAKLLPGFSQTPSPALRRRGRPPVDAPFDELSLPYLFRSVISVDQAPIGKTPRSTPATYLGIFDLIRPFFASLPEARMRGWNASRFSFNTTEGRCPTCEGAGRVRYEMAFLPDSYLPCEDCCGSRYRPDLAEIVWKGRSIGQVLALSFEEAASFFDFHAQLGEVCRLMVECGLGYLTLGQSSPTLSGGEAQRLKLVYELAQGLPSYRERSRGLTPRNLYLLEEPTIGLHSSDCEKLIQLLQRLVDQGHTVIVIEHNLDLLAEADWIVELGPGGGPAGGRLLYQGPVDGLLSVADSPTAPFLAEKFEQARRIASGGHSG